MYILLLQVVTFLLSFPDDISNGLVFLVSDKSTVKQVTQKRLKIRYIYLPWLARNR